MLHRFLANHDVAWITNCCWLAVREEIVLAVSFYPAQNNSICSLVHCSCSRIALWYPKVCRDSRTFWLGHTPSTKSESQTHQLLHILRSLDLLDTVLHIQLANIPRAQLCKCSFHHHRTPHPIRQSCTGDHKSYWRVLNKVRPENNHIDQCHHKCLPSPTIRTHCHTLLDHTDFERNKSYIL